MCFEVFFLPFGCPSFLPPVLLEGRCADTFDSWGSYGAAAEEHDSMVGVG